jgi:hypothetical protein
MKLPEVLCWSVVAAAALARRAKINSLFDDLRILNICPLLERAIKGPLHARYEYEKNSESHNRVEVGQNGYLRAHPDKRAPHQGAGETQNLFLARCADRGQPRQQACRYRRVDTRPGDGVVDDVTEARRKAAFQRELKVLRIGERFRGEKLPSR